MGKLKVKIKAEGKQAKQLLQAANSMADASGANFVSRNDLHIPNGTSSGKSGASQRVPHKALKGIAGKDVATPELVGNESEQVNKPETGAVINLKPEGFGPSYVGEDVDTVKTVARDLNPVERARQKNNRTRDARTNLGRGKPGIVEIE